MFIRQRMAPEDSYSRQLDHEVASTEPPYGYDNSPSMIMHEMRESPEYERHEEKTVESFKKNKRK